MVISCYYFSIGFFDWGGNFMTFTDIVIIIIILVIVGFILYQQFKHKDESICASCSYARGCTDKVTKKKAS